MAIGSTKCLDITGGLEMSAISMKPTISKSESRTTEWTRVEGKHSICLTIYNEMWSQLDTCIDCSRHGLHLFIYHHRLRAREHLNIWGQVPTVQDSMEGRVCVINQPPEDINSHSSLVNTSNMETNMFFVLGYFLSKSHTQTWLVHSSCKVVPPLWRFVHHLHWGEVAPPSYPSHQSSVTGNIQDRGMHLFQIANLQQE